MCVFLYLTCLVGGGLVVAPGMTHVGLHLRSRPSQLLGNDGMVACEERIRAREPFVGGLVVCQLWYSNSMSAWGACDGSRSMLPVAQACGHLGEGSDVYDVMFKLLGGAAVTTCCSLGYWVKNGSLVCISGCTQFGGELAG